MKSARVLCVFDDPDALARAAAEEFRRRAGEAIRLRGRFTVALSGGGTPRLLFRELAAGPADWGRVHLFWCDERTVPPDDPESNARLAREELLSKVPVPAENVHRIHGEDPEPARAAAAYEEELRRTFRLGSGEFPRLDLVLLGMGPDGHTASLFPGTDVLLEETRLVAAHWVPKLEASRITLTRPVLNHAACALFLVTGGEKAEMLRQVVEGPPRPLALPAQAIQPENGELLWFVDAAAARMLAGRGPRNR